MEQFTQYLILTISALVLSGFFSGMEISFISSNKVKAEIDIKKGGLVSQILGIFYAHRETFISTMLVGNNIVNVIYGIGVAWLLREPLEGWLGKNNDALVLLLQTIISTVIVLLMGEFLPKTTFRINPNRSLRIFAVPLLFLYLILYPISKFISWLSAALMKLFNIKNEKKEIRLISVGELNDYLQENIDKSEDENREVEREVKIFENALDFSDTRLRDCMIPRNEIVAVNIAETSREELSKLFTKSGLSKLVVYHDDIDNVLGFIQVSELFKHDVNWKDQIKPVIIAPETMLAKKMMQHLLKEKKSMAIVVDEFGGTAGMVTLEDLVEEIFGDIEDEHDRRRLIARKTGENTYELSGRMEIERINELFDLDIPESDDYQTIAGYIVNRLEVIPNQDEKHNIDQFTVTITKKSGARLELITLTVHPDNKDNN